jgi:hypothetical protein
MGLPLIALFISTEGTHKLAAIGRPNSNETNGDQHFRAAHNQVRQITSEDAYD